MKAVLCIDMEPDQRTPDPAARVDWLGAERLIGNHDWLRDRVGNQALNWFLRLDRQVEYLHGDAVWAAERFADDLHRLIGLGDEVGVHPHNWRWTRQGWLPDGSTSWVVENAECALESYATVFGVDPPSFRYGDRFVSDDVVRVLLRHPQVKVDLTTEPGVRACRGLVEAERARVVTRHVDPGLARRYRPEGGAVDIPSRFGDLTMVPLTSAAIPGTGTVDTLSLWRSPEEFDRMLRVRLLDRELDHLAFAVRSDLALLPWAIEDVVTNLDTLARWIDDLEWVRASTLALRPHDRGDQGLGMIGSIAATVDDVIRVIHPEPPLVVAPLADAVRGLVERNAALAEQNRGLVERNTALVKRDDALVGHNRDLAERNDTFVERVAAMSAAHAEVASALVAERIRVAELTDAITAERSRADDASARLDRVEQTAWWRLRTRMLPALRPLASARRVALRRRPK